MRPSRVPAGGLCAVLAVFSVSLSLAAEQPANRDGSTEYLNPADRQAAAALEEALDKPLPDLKAVAGDKAELPLGELLAAIGKAANVTISVDESALKDADVPLDRPARVPLFPHTALSLRAALGFVLFPEDLAFVNRAGVLRVTTQELAEEQLVVRVYGVSDLLAVPPKPDGDAAEPTAQTDGSSGTPSDGSRSRNVELANYVEQCVSGPWFEIDGTGGVVEPFSGRLVVRQTQPAHRDVSVLIGATRQAIAAGPGGPPVAAEYGSAADRQAAAKLEAALDRPLPELPASDGSEPVKARELLAAVAVAAGIDVRIDEKALTDAGASLDAPAKLTRPAGPPASARSALDLLLGPLNLAYVNRAGVLVVTSWERADEMTATRVYHVSDLLAGVSPLRSWQMKPRCGTPEPGGPGMSGGALFAVPVESSGPADKPVGGTPCPGEAGNKETRPAEAAVTYSAAQQLIDVVRRGTSGPWFDIDGTGGTLGIYGDVIAIRQSQAVHRELEAMFAGLREARGPEATAGPAKP
jgi:hypothetical protein